MNNEWMAFGSSLVVFGLQDRCSRYDYDRIDIRKGSTGPVETVAPSHLSPDWPPYGSDWQWRPHRPERRKEPASPEGPAG